LWEFSRNVAPIVNWQFKIYYLTSKLPIKIINCQPLEKMPPDGVILILLVSHIKLENLISGEINYHFSS
jgi:hypothetical protein